jgi:hypothetical protein
MDPVGVDGRVRLPAEAAAALEGLDLEAELRDEEVWLRRRQERGPGARDGGAG